jgi:hypothetical protein
MIMIVFIVKNEISKFYASLAEKSVYKLNNLLPIYAFPSKMSNLRRDRTKLSN